MTSITIADHPVLGKAVSARELYGLVFKSKSKRDGFTDWFKDRERKLKLMAGKDFVAGSAMLPSATSTRKHLEYQLTLETARKIAAVQLAKGGVGVLAFLKDYQRQLSQDRINRSNLPTTPALNLDRPISPPIYGSFNNPVESNGELRDSVGSSVAEVDAKPSMTPFQELLFHIKQVARRDDELLAQQERISTLERKVGTLVDLIHQATRTLMGELPTGLGDNLSDHQLLPDMDEAGTEQSPTLEPIGSPAEAETDRTKLVRLVSDYSDARKVDHKDVWRWLYSMLNDTYYFSASKHKIAGDKTYLDTVERHHQLPNLYRIARSYLVSKAGPTAG